MPKLWYISESVALLKRWHEQANGRIRYCFAPRFAVSCTRELLQKVAELSRKHEVLVHTHASENLDEIAIVEQLTGKRNIEYLYEVGLAAQHIVLAHCIHLDETEMETLRLTGTHVAHCPSSNLKLASGIARVAEMIERGISVSLGADGAPCNNRLDMFTEMRTAALLQKMRHHSQTLPALTALRLATIGGARAMGLANQIGSIELGKSADLQLLNLNTIHTTPIPDTISAIVYAAETNNVETVLIDGQVIMHRKKLLTLDEKQVIEDANHHFDKLKKVISYQQKEKAV